MTIEDQIRDEKIQYNFNRETAKISALSSGKIDKYKYLPSEEILPSNRQQVMEQAKFAYSLLGKVFEKQTKTIEGQGEKQRKAIQDKRPLKSIEKYYYSINDSPLVLKEEEIYKFTEESFEKINILDKKVDTNKLVFKYKGKTADEDFGNFDNAHDLTDKIRNGENSLNDAKDDQIKLRSELGEIRKLQKTFINRKQKCPRQC